MFDNAMMSNYDPISPIHIATTKQPLFLVDVSILRKYARISHDGTLYTCMHSCLNHRALTSIVIFIFLAMNEYGNNRETSNELIVLFNRNSPATPQNRL